MAHKGYIWAKYDARSLQSIKNT